MGNRLAKRLLVIGWDGADWQVIRPLIDQGKMPHLQSVIEGGVMGNFSSMNPMISPMLWTTMATGKPPHKHGICGFTEPDPHSENGRRLTGSTSRKCKAFWNILTQNKIKNHVVGWYAGHPSEPIDGVCVSERFAKAYQNLNLGWPVPAGSVHPKELESTLAEIRVHPEQMALEHLISFVPDAASIDQKRDRRLQTLAKNISQCATNQAVTTWIMETQPWEVVATYFNTIDLVSHTFMYFHPPKLDHVSDQFFQLYKNVVNETYRFHDLMLGRLLELAGEECTVIIVSDHGYQSGNNRPLVTPADPAGAIQWHRPHGIFAAKGAGIKQDELVFGGRILDLTPTILTLMGLPVADDMAGRPLLQIFESPMAVEQISSWEDVDGEAGMHDPMLATDSVAELEAMKQLEALGYLEIETGDKQTLMEKTANELKFNVARSLISIGKHVEAIPELEAVVEFQPRRLEAAFRLANCYQAVGDQQKCRALIDKIAKSEFDDRTVESSNAKIKPQLDYMYGMLELNSGNHEAAIARFEEAEKQMGDRPAKDFYKNLGNAYLQMEDWERCRNSYEKAVQIEPDDAAALHGLSIVALNNEQPELAVDLALRSLQILFHQPRAHYHLGMASWQLGDYERARQAFETCLSMRPQADDVRQKLNELEQLGKLN